jgi:hypothetical protein
MLNSSYRLIKIRCIKSFVLDGGSMPILKNECFWSIDDEYMEFRGDMQFSIYGEDNSIKLTNKQLEENFEFVNTRIKYNN